MAFAIRVPTINVSLVDLSFVAARDTTVDEVNAAMQEAADGPLKGVMLAYNTASRWSPSTSITTRPRPVFTTPPRPAKSSGRHPDQGATAGTTTSGASAIACST
jgi:hypothetical protein